MKFRVFFPFNGLGAGARGFLASSVRVLDIDASFECTGGVDFDANACADFEYLTGTPAWAVDVMTVEAFWTPAMFRAAFGECPDVVFLSPPCKGASSLLSAEKAKTKEYRQLNRLAVVWLTSMLEAGWLPKLILLENVPNLPTRARAMLRSIRSLLRSAGYVFSASTHDCGELGGLAQHRRRYLLVARRPSACPSILYEPTKKRVRGVGEVLSALPMPATQAASAWGDLHEMPKISWRNWLRLALIPAGGDWRDLAGVLEGRARREVFRRHAVQAWDDASPAVTGPGGHSVGALGDPRAIETETWRGRYGVLRPDQPAGTVTSGDRPSKGRFAIADDRVQLSFDDAPGRHDLKYAVRGWDDPAKTIIGKTQPGSGAQSVADVRIASAQRGAYGVEGWDEPAATVTGEVSPSNGTRAVADELALGVKRAFDAGYGVLRWDEPSRAVAGTQAAGTGAYSVADARDRGFLENVRMLSLDEAMELDLDPDKPPPFTPVIIAEDRTWHRPMTLLELATLQGLPSHVNGKPLRLHGTRTERAEHIGNAVPEGAAKEIGNSMLVALVEGALGTMSLSGGGDVWVEPTRSVEVYV